MTYNQFEMKGQTLPFCVTLSSSIMQYLQRRIRCARFFARLGAPACLRDKARVFCSPPFVLPARHAAEQQNTAHIVWVLWHPAALDALRPQ
jgi:hypothetical protein